MDFQFISEENGLQKKEAYIESYDEVGGVLNSSPCQSESVFVVRRDLNGETVQCNIEGDLMRLAEKAIGRRVNVFGRKLVSKDGKSKAIVASRMRLLPREEDIPTIDEMVGICPDMTGGLSSEAYARKRFYGD